ncbi:MAG: ABC transporter permease [Alphaproteobacteria bacterium]|nr:ABC transporter permease [Alphaproteobacteria bacterium]
MSEPDLTRPELIAEFRRNPVGRHSPDLRLLLNTLRKADGEEPYVLVCTKPHREWRLARKKAGRGQALTLLDGAIFTDADAAEWAVFKLRWARMTGREIGE